ncbi:DUF2147 domain-containing protein [Jiella sp. M17.18]|uniref:DUF2147 domain-containing protein n=1 Tax=Jiella sp. M17.18 TaxID=3234247 RepID=UPI0034DDE812
MRMRSLALGCAVAAGLALHAGLACADPIEGDWTLPAGETARAAPCGDALCLTYASGPQRGKMLARVKRTARGDYAGIVFDPANGDRRYAGRGWMAEGSLLLSRCVLGGLICRTRRLERPRPDSPRTKF